MGRDGDPKGRRHSAPGRQRALGIGHDLPDGATPIDPEEAEGLIPALSTQAELNAFEAYGIVEATGWAFGNSRFLKRLLTDEGLRRLHRRMFGATWKWGGAYRKTQKSIGVESYRISTEIHNLLGDVECWLESETFPPAEIAARFHHRLVQIHPFANGNGRHARLATDLLCQSRGWPISSWGDGDLVQAGNLRQRYIEALRRADAHDYVPLIEFMNISSTSFP